jgi:simple sugar transport system substrate-binding protein/ribose transport system substrate-binding protein
MNMMIRQYAGLLLAPLAVTAWLSAASADDAKSVKDFPLAQRIADKVKSGQPLDIYVSYHDVSNEFAPQIKAGVERGGKTDDVNVHFIGPVGADADKQISELESLMPKMDGLAISSVSTDALSPVIDRFIAAGIPVVAFNTDNPASKRLVFAGQDLVQSGREAGKLMVKTLDGKGKVLITTIDAAAQWSIDREKGAREALGAAKDIQIVQTVNTGTDPQQIYSAIENAMLAHPDVSGILSLECCSTPAAGTWVDRNNKIGQVKVVGFDLLDATVELVKKGAVEDTIDQAPEKQGFAAVDLLVKFLKGESISTVDTGVGIYDKSNIDQVAKK